MNPIVLDTETSDQNRYTCKIDRVCFSDGTEWNFRKIVHLGCVALNPVPVVMHNAAFDLYILTHRLGVKVTGPVYDTMLMAKHWRNDLPSYSLKWLSWYLFGDTDEPLRKLRQWMYDHRLSSDEDDFDMTKPPDRLVHNYCAHDVEMTERLYEFLKDKVATPAFRLDCDLIVPLMDMEKSGITVDKPFLQDFIRRSKRRIRDNTRLAANEMGVEGRKPTGVALREYVGKLVPVPQRTPTGMVATDDAVLHTLTRDCAIRAVQRIRSDQKLQNTYAQNILDVVGEGNTFHPNLMQSAAITRRFKSRNMYGDNGLVVKGQVQNIPRGPGIRSAFIVPSGYAFAKMDLASIEARLGAHAMAVFMEFDFYAKKYRESDSFNIYLWVVERYTEHGKVSKKDPIYTAYKHAVLGIQYGVGVETYYKTMTDKFRLPYTLEECDAIYRTIRHECPEFAELQRRVSSIVQEQGYIMDDFGATYYVPQMEKYKGVNYYCQGCAGNVLKWWWIEVHKAMQGTKDYIFNAVHDELDCAIHRDRSAERRLKAYCDLVRGLDLFELPIVAETSGLVANWGEAG